MVVGRLADGFLMTDLSCRTNVLAGVLTLIVCAFVPAMSATGGEYYSKKIEVCNSGKEQIWVATAYRSETSLFGPTTWRVKGWKKVSPNDCIEVHSSYTDPESRYSLSDSPFLALSQIGKDGRSGIATHIPEVSLFGGDYVTSASRQFCVQPTDHFKYEFSGEKMTMENCGPPFELVEFSIEVTPPYGRDSEITVNIDPSKAALVTPFSSPPSAAVVPEKKAEPEPNLLAELFEAYKEARKEERRALRERPVDSPKQQADVDAALALALLLAAQGNPQSDHPKQPDAPPKPGWLGITIQDVPQELAKSLKIREKVVSGVLVKEVIKDGPATKAIEMFGEDSKVGLLPGDIIVSINCNKEFIDLDNAKQLLGIIQSVKSGDPIDLHILRQGKSLFLSLVAGDRPVEKS